MAKPTYIIMKDQPVPNSYAQYVYDVTSMLSDTGLNTLDPGDDLYTIMELEHDVSSTFYTNMDFDDGLIQMEGYSLWVAYPNGITTAYEPVGVEASILKIWFFDGAGTIESDFGDFDSVGNLVSGMNTFYSQTSPYGEDSENTALSTYNFTGYHCGGQSDHMWDSGVIGGYHTDEFDVPPDLDSPSGPWFSPYNEWSGVDCWDFLDNRPPVIGINETNYNNFLHLTPGLSWTEYMEDIFYNYAEYDGTDPSHYFYVVVENELSLMYLWQAAGPFRNTTRGVYRYPKRMILDAWDNGDSITTENIMWRLFTDNNSPWPESYIPTNDGQCVNQIMMFGTSFAPIAAATIEDAEEYYEADSFTTWDDITSYGTVPTCSNQTGATHIRPALNLNATGPTVDVDDFPPYQPFFNMGGHSWIEFIEESHVIFADADLGGYNIYFNEGFPGLEQNPFITPFTYSNWRPVSNVFIGDDYLTATYLQTYYEFDTFEYLSTSAPNIVNLYFSVQDQADLTGVVDEMFGQEYYQKIIDIYMQAGMEEITVETLLSEYNSYLSQNLKFFVFNWDWKDDDLDFEEIVFPYTDEEMLAYNYNDNTFIAQTAFNNDGSPNTLQHQYNSPGLKTIKGFVMSTITNDHIDGPQEHVLVIKGFTTRIYVGLDDIYIEDFADIGGPDFTFIPWPYTSPVISGIDDNSQYINSLTQVVDNNLFSDEEIIERNFARKAVANQELGDFVGSTNFEQVRVFLDGSYDMAKLLGIESYYENVDAGTYYTYFPYDKFEGLNRWDGINNKYPEETSVGSIFINESIDLNLLSSCLVELNLGSSDGRTIRDSSGNGNKGILIGDFKVKKEDKDIPLRRDSVMQTPSTDTKGRAI